MGDAPFKSQGGFAQALCALSVLTNTVACGGSHVSDAQPMQEPAGKNASPSAPSSAVPSAAASASVVSVAPPSKLVPPPTLAEAGGKCVCGEPKQIGTSAFAPSVMDVLPKEPLVKIAATTDQLLAVWEDKDDSLTSIVLDHEGNPTASAITTPGIGGTSLFALPDGNFAFLDVVQAWILSPTGMTVGAPAQVLQSTAETATQTSLRDLLSLGWSSTRRRH